MIHEGFDHKLASLNWSVGYGKCCISYFYIFKYSLKILWTDTTMHTFYMVFVVVVSMLPHLIYKQTQFWENWDTVWKKNLIWCNKWINKCNWLNIWLTHTLFTMEQKNPQKSNVKLRKCDILGKVLARFGFDASNMFQKSWHNKRLEKWGLVRRTS